VTKAKPFKHGRKITQIFWDDHSSDGGTIEKDEVEKMEPAPFVQASVGYIIKENKKAIVISQSVDEKSGVSERLTILKRDIVWRKDWC